MKLIIQLFVILLILQLIACGAGVDSVNLPPERKSSSISGFTLGGSLTNAEINVYSFNNGNKGKQLANGTIDETGFFEINVKEKSQVILLEATAGTYTEPATDEKISMQEGQVISTLAYYQTEKPLNTQLSALTHIAASHIKYQTRNKQDFFNSFENTSQSLKNLFETDVFSSFTNESSNALNKPKSIDDITMHKQFLSAISSLSNWLAQQNGYSDQKTINTLELIRVMHNDITADGLLDGWGFNTENEATRLSIGSIALNADVYRMGIAQHLLAYSQNPLNTSGISSEVLLPVAENFANNQHALFGTDEIKSSPLMAPELSSQYLAPKNKDDTFKLSIDVDSVVDIASARFDINGESLDSATSPNHPTLEFNSNQYEDGEYNLGVSVSDILGNTTYLTIPVIFDSIYPSNINGFSINGRLAEANVAISTFSNGNKGEHLGSGKSDISGFFEISVKSQSQVVLIEATNGFYREAATDEQIVLQDGQTISTMADYVSGEPLSTRLSPLTHIASSLIQFKLKNGETFSEAKSNVTQIFQDIFNVDVFAIPSLTPNETESGEPELITNDAMHNIYLSTLSGFSAWFAVQNGHPDQSIFNTVELVNIMSKDIIDDGLLDGLGVDNNKQAIQLALGSVALDANVYRMGIALYLMAYLSSDTNNSGISDTELLSLAKAISKSEHPLFGAAKVDTVPALSPLLSHDYPETISITGVFRLDVGVKSFIDLENMVIYLDGELIGGINTPDKAEFTLDSNSYSDGEHEIEVIVTDVFGNESSLTIPVIFDNISLTIDTPLITNQENLTLSGRYFGDDIVVISVDNIPMAISLDGTWSGEISLNLGDNPLLIKIEDISGYQEEFTFNMILDQTPPVIDTKDKHSIARFSLSDGTYQVEQLEDENNLSLPLYFESDSLSLSGLSVDRSTLQDNNIPFFGFTIIDAPDGINNTPLDDLNVELRYLKNNVQIGEAKQLSATENEYLVPLVSEFLHINWDQTNPSDTHKIQITATDIAGNTQIQDFTFHADIYVPEMQMDAVNNIPQDVFATTPFNNRIVLNEFNFESTEYLFTNTTGRDFYIRLQDDNIHEVKKVIDEKIRKHLWRTKTITEWQAGQITNALITNQCPTASEMHDITQIYNYAGEQLGWVLEMLPAPTYGEASDTDSDDLPENDPSTLWQDASQSFVDPYMEESDFNSFDQTTLFYEFDYIFSGPSIAWPASIRNWYVEDNNKNIIKNCPNISFFQARQHFFNESVDTYPKNVATTAQESETFTTKSFNVFDTDTASTLLPQSGWYHIRAGHRIRITKTVTTPYLELYDDVLDDSDFTSYILRRQDKTLRWSINNSITIETTFDAGEENLNLMSPRSQDVGEGTTVYELHRN